METLLVNGQIIDGSGAKAYAGDVLLRDDRIAAVGKDLSAKADEIVDLEGLVLAPGFIDIHTHFDAQVFWDPELTPSSWHGITTVLMGNCGFGVAPTRPSDHEVALWTLQAVEGMPFEALVAGMRWEFETFPEYLSILDRLPKAINVAALIGHTPIRRYVLGDAATKRAASPEEIARMRALVRDALVAGALGFSTSRLPVHVGGDGEPVPSRLAEWDEILELSLALGDLGRGIMEVAPGPGILVEESAELSRRNGRPLTWPFIDGQDYEILKEGRLGRSTDYASSAAKVVEDLYAAGGNIVPQVSCRPIWQHVSLATPYLWASLPSFREVIAAAPAARAGIYADRAWRDRARPEVNEKWMSMWDRVMLEETVNHPELRGRFLLAIAEDRGIDPFDAMLDISIDDGLRARFAALSANFDEVQIKKFLTDDRIVVGLSDAGAHTDTVCDACFSTYLLGHWVRELEAFPIERGIRMLTGQLAELLEIGDRGFIRPGYLADLVAFDPDSVGPGETRRVADLPGGAERLVVESRGVEHIWVNGTATRTNDKMLPSRPGRVVRG